MNVRYWNPWEKFVYVKYRPPFVNDIFFLFIIEMRAQIVNIVDK